MDKTEQSNPVNVFTCDTTNISEQSATILSFIMGKDFEQWKKKPFFDYIGYQLSTLPIITFFPIPSDKVHHAISLFRESKKDSKKNIVLIYSTKSITDNHDLKKLFIQLNELHSTLHPSVVICTQSNETKDTLISMLSKENKVNRRLITVIQHKKDDKQFQMALILQILNLHAYYNQMAERPYWTEYSKEQKRKRQAQKINFIVCGKTGVGKSSLINELFEDQLSLEGELLSCTNKIVQHTHEELPLSIYDTPGIENNKIADDVLQHINNVFKSNDSSVQDIHMLFYLCNAQARDLLEVDKYFLSALTKWKNETNIKLPVTFIITRSKTPKNGQEMKDTLRRGLKSIDFNEYDEIFPIEFGDSYGNTNYFGMKDLVTKLVEHFEPHARPAVMSLKLQQVSTESQIKDFALDNIFLRRYGGSPSQFLRQNLNQSAHQLALSYSIVNYVLNSGQERDAKCLKDIAKLYNYTITMKEIDQFLNTVNNDKVKAEINGSEWSDLVDELKIKGDVIFRHRLYLKAHCFIDIIESKKEIQVSDVKPLLMKKIEEVNKGIEGLKKFIDRFDKVEHSEDEFYYND